LHISKYDQNMKFLIRLIFLIFFIFVFSCADYNNVRKLSTKERKFYSSKGFALIYNPKVFLNGDINKKFSTIDTNDKKINDEQILVMHSFLKKNTLIKIVNPVNSKFVNAKVNKIANYPKIFNIVISKKISKTLDLDTDNPYIEIYEIKKNKTFIAKESDMFEEEKQVAESVPVNEVKMDDLSAEKILIKKKNKKSNNFTLVVSDFYYIESANLLKDELIKKTKSNKILVKKINNNKYRLLVGPFENFNALKNVYISLNNLGFEDLNIYNN
jgi:hypothetical protein